MFEDDFISPEHKKAYDDNPGSLIVRPGTSVVCHQRLLQTAFPKPLDKDTEL